MDDLNQTGTKLNGSKDYISLKKGRISRPGKEESILRRPKNINGATKFLTTELMGQIYILASVHSFFYHLL